MTPLKRQLGLTAVLAIVMGDMMGTGIFFTPGELAQSAERPWQIFFIWSLCGLVVLSGALTLAELTALFPRPGATYHIMHEAYGPGAAFVKVWMEVWVSAPGSIAGVAIGFGGYVVELLGSGSEPVWGVVAIVFFAAVNLLGVQWGGRAQILLTGIKITGLVVLVGGSFLLADAVTPTAAPATTGGLSAFLRFIGVGVAAVFFTYDGWVDVSHVAGEVKNPRTTLPLGLGVGVLGIVVLYLIVNYAFLRVMPLETMRAEGLTVAATLATATFGSAGGRIVTVFIMVSIFGALGGLVMTAPRLLFAPASEYGAATNSSLLRRLAYVSPGTGAPAVAIVFSALLSIVAISFFQTFDRLVAFILVPLQLMNVATVAAVFRLRKRPPNDGQYLTPGYPWVPLLFVVVVTFLMANAAIYNPSDTLIGVAMTAVGAPVYLWLTRRKS